jgi:hypothetical protein
LIASQSRTSKIGGLRKSVALRNAAKQGGVRRAATLTFRRSFLGSPFVLVMITTTVILEALPALNAEPRLLGTGCTDEHH